MENVNPQQASINTIPLGSATSYPPNPNINPPSQFETKKSSFPGGKLVFVLLVVLFIIIIAILYYKLLTKTDKKQNNLTPNTIQNSNQMQVEKTDHINIISLYTNPFSSSSHYVNPFSTITNPLLLLAEGKEDVAQEQKFNVIFPISNLGSCDNLYNCTQYCSHITHSEECLSYAKSKGFFKEVTSENMQKILAIASDELKCSTQSQCLADCSKEANFQKCTDFALKNELSGGLNPIVFSTVLLQDAQRILGCKSFEECKAKCDETANYKICSDFAAKSEIRGGNYTIGPGGCTDENECSQVCNKDQQLCTNFYNAHKE